MGDGKKLGLALQEIEGRKTMEELRTDESSDPPAKRPADFDTQMLFGCSGFVSASFVTYGLTVWPNLVWSETHKLQVLVQCFGFGLLPAAVFGIVASRKFGLAGGAGFVGGAMASATFIFLRLQQVMAFRGIREAPQPEYPYPWMWIAPSGWVLLALILAILFVPKEELSTLENRQG